jgi:valyl-tRNA synthetase
LGRGDGRGVRTTIEEEAEVIRVLSRVEPLRIVSGRGEASLAPTPQSQGITLVVNPLVVRLSLEGVVDLVAEGKRLREELASCLKNLSRVEALVSNPDFRAKAKEEVVEREEERRKELEERRQRLDEILAQLR